jgi:putative transposase
VILTSRMANSNIREHFVRAPRSCYDWRCAIWLLLLHLATVARLADPGGARAVVAESVLVKHRLLILNRSRKRSPNLRPCDRVVAGLCALFMRPGRLIRAAIVIRPSTQVNLHRALILRKYHRLFSSTGATKPGPRDRASKSSPPSST